MEDEECKESRKFIQANGLVDLDFADPRFSWCHNCQGGARCERGLIESS